MDSQENNKEVKNRSEQINDVVVFGPGGIKAFLELGSLYYLEKTGRLKHTKTYIGVSAGSLICLLLNIGLTAKEIIYLAISDSSIIDIDISKIDVVKSINTFKNKLGFFSKDKIIKNLSRAIVEKWGHIPTLGELHEITGKELVVVSYPVGATKGDYFSYRNFPNLLCINPVLLSINIPIVFHVEKFNNKLYIDGAFGDPYPVLWKDDGKNNILGVYIKTSVRDPEYKNPLLYLHDIVHAFFHVMTARNIEQASDKCLHIELDTDIIDTLGTTVTMEDKAHMIIAGIEKTAAVFGDRNYTL
jgi:predicted acylesterase/phospholipase RssA